jgi:hypothetical protein
MRLSLRYESMLPFECLSNADACMKALHSTADLWFGRLLLSTKVVAVGLIFEAPELAYDTSAIVRRKIDKWKRRETSSEFHAVPDWAKVIAFIGWILIVGGVVGEWFAESKIYDSDTSIQELNDTLLKEATNNAGDAKTSAKDAESDASNAKASADAASFVAGDALSKSRAATDAASNAQQEAVAVEKQADDLLAKYKKAENELDSERATRQELEKSLAPRELFILRYADGTYNTDELKKFSGTSALIEYIPDFEAERAARFIASALEASGWTIAEVNSSTVIMFDGISVERYNGPERGNLDIPDNFKLSQLDYGEEMRSLDACEAVVDFLRDSNVVANTGVTGRATDLPPKNDIPPRSVRIRVGFKPNPYFEPGPVKDAKKREESIVNRIRPRRKPTSPIVTVIGVSPWFPLRKKP